MKRPAHTLQISWDVEHSAELNGKPVIFARAIMPGGAEYVTWHVCSGKEAPMLLWLIIETLTVECLQVCGTSDLVPAPGGVLGGVQHA